MGPVEVLLALALIIYVLCYNINRLLGLPPGPTPWPIVGNTFQLPMSGIDQRLLELKKEYGDVFTLWIPYPTVMINDYEALKRTIVKNGEAYAGRPTTYIMEILVQGNYGLLFEENEWYKSQRRFTLHTLRDLGVGKNSIQLRRTTMFSSAPGGSSVNEVPMKTNELLKKDTITVLIHRTVDLLRKTNGEPIELRPYLTHAVGNVINQLSFGYTRTHEDRKIIEIQEYLAKVGEFFNDPKILLLDAVPFLRHFDSLLGLGIKSTKYGSDAIIDFIQKNYLKEFDEHKKNVNYDQEPTNFLDAYIHELHRKEKEGVQDEFTEKQCVVAVYDLYTAGMETIVVTLRFCFLYLLNYPHLQEKIHREIDKTIGCERDVTMDDQRILPYTCAFLQEIYRTGYVLYVNFLRITMEDVNCEGYKIRKGTRVIPQYPSVHMDETIYPRPELVIPERHLKDGQFIRDDRITGFSSGKRACIGENLARMEVFMFFTSLMQKFHFEPEGLYPPELKTQISALRSPLTYKIRVIERKI